MSLEELSELVSAAAGGDQTAWDRIVERHAQLVWAVARGFGLGAADAADVCQATWLRLVEHLGDLRNPAGLASWLATTARREALNLLRKRRDVPLLEVDVAADEPVPGEDLLTGERDRELWRAFRRLPDRCQALLRLLVLSPSVNYAAAAATLEVPVGSLGPTRARCLGTLRRELRPYTEVDGR